MKNYNLNLLLAGQLVSQTGDKFYMIALSFMVLESTGSAAKMGLVLFAGMLPIVVVGLVAGVFVDRINRKKIIVLTDVLRAIIVSVVSFLYFQKILAFWMIIFSQVLLGINSAFFNPAVLAAIPIIVDKENISKANARTQFISGFSNIAGPALGGYLVSLYGYFIVFFLNAVSYFISALFECFLKIPDIKPDKPQNLSVAFKEGYQHIFNDQKLLIILLMVFIIHFFYGSVEVSIPVIADFLPGKGPANMGYIQTAFGLGAVGMALLLSYISISGKESSMLFRAVLCMGMSLVFISLGGVWAPFIMSHLVLFFLFSSTVILAGTSFQSLIQKNTEPEMTGRVFGVVSSVGNFSIPFAMLIYGFLLDYLNIHLIIGISGMMIIFVTIAASRFFKKA